MHYVGIDVSKRSLDVCLLAEGSKGSRKTKTLSNGQDSAQNLAKWLILQKCELSQTHVIMEATGIYHEYLACGLHQ
ncbi:IS110 family transposase, partial [Salmonella enterica]|nr:IS110 family transposase [Salmonella enterica]EIP7312546.1 transposase [Salmonella enterica]